MSPIAPLIAAFLQSGSTLLDKAILRIHGVGSSVYLGLGFPILFVVSALIFIVVSPPFSFALFAGVPGILFMLSCAALVGGNFLNYRALQADEVQEVQIVDLLHRVPVLVVSSLLFADERDPFTLVATLVASMAVFWSHYEHHHFRMRHKTIVLLAYVLIVTPFSAAMWKTLLYTWHPVSLELARNAVLALVFGAMYRNAITHVPGRVVGLLFLTNALTAVAWILFAFGYQTVGIVHTMLLFSLQPFLVYLGALFFLKEKFHPKKFIAFVVVLASIVFVQLQH
jgi:drug/metabolite transporter (DMT)-like permease